MRTKRLLCVLAALALLLSVPARAAEEVIDPDPAVTEEAEAPEETPEVPGEVPETPEIPEIPEETPPEVPAEPPEPPDELPEEPEDPAPPAEEEVPDEEPPAEEPAEEEAEEPEDEPAPQEEPPVIQVMVPDAGRVVVNPYRLEVATDGGASTDQIVSAPMPIISYSSVPVAVMASATGQALPGSEAVFVSAPPRSDAGSKELFVFAEFQPALDEYGSAFWSGVYTGAPNQLPVTAWGATPAQVLTLEAGDVVPSCGAFRLFGSAAGSPDSVWSVEDTIQVSIAFTFLPLE